MVAKFWFLDKLLNDLKFVVVNMTKTDEYVAYNR